MRWVATLLLFLWTAVTEARYGIDYNAKAAYFNFGPSGSSEYVFALNAAANGDVYFHMSGPKTHCWIGVGFGSEMANSFMIITYPASNGFNTTISTRIGTGHNEPTYTPDYEIVKVYNDTYAPNANTVVVDSGVIIAHAMCRNCSQWAGGFLDTRSKAQPMLFALGPPGDFREDSPAAGLPRHVLYGTYTMDMTEATNYTGWYGRVPAPNIPNFVFPPNDTSFASTGTTPSVDYTAMSNPLPAAHGVLMCVAFVLIFPAGAVVMQVLKNVLAHAVIQVVGFVAVFVAFGVGVRIAGQYNKSKDFNSAHQVIGFIILLGLLAQLGLGLLHHTIYARTNRPTPFGRIHFFLGPFIMLLGLINVGVGFNFAGNSRLNIPYGIVVAILAAIVFAVLACYFFTRSRRKYKPDQLNNSPYEDHEYSKNGTMYTDHEMNGQTHEVEVEVPAPYEAMTPYSPRGGQFILTSPYEPMTPYTPTSAYTPVTPRTWKKEEVTNWPLAPYKEFT